MRIEEMLLKLYDDPSSLSRSDLIKLKPLLEGLNLLLLKELNRPLKIDKDLRKFKGIALKERL